MNHIGGISVAENIFFVYVHKKGHSLWHNTETQMCTFVNEISADLGIGLANWTSVGFYF